MTIESVEQETKSSLTSMREGLFLSTGRQCSLSSPHVPGLQNYYVLALSGTANSSEEADEFQLFAHRIARDLAEATFANRECYALMYSAGATRRKPWPHVHLIIAESVRDRRRSVVLLQFKHLLWWRRWVPFFRK